MYNYYFHYLTVTAVLCYFQFKLFNYFTKKNTLTLKQSAYILSVCNSFTTFVCSIYLFSCFYDTYFDENLYRISLTPFGNYIGLFSLCYFMSYVIMDTIIGFCYYHKYMISLSGYFHHIFYFIVNLFTMYYERHMIFMMFFVSELPTLILGIGSINESLRSNYLFGITFFITRIVYHISMVFVLNSYKLILLFGGIASVLHVFWFKNWLKKYA